MNRAYKARGALTTQRGDIPKEVLDFIERRIDSVPHLETLLLLHEDSAVSWTEERVSARVYVSRDQARAILRDLVRHGLIAGATGVPDQYLYDPAWDDARLMPKVAATYRRYLVDLAGLIHSKASSEAVRDFARAFKIKRKD